MAYALLFLWVRSYCFRMCKLFCHQSSVHRWRWLDTQYVFAFTKPALKVHHDKLKVEAVECASDIVKVLQKLLARHKLHTEFNRRVS